MDMMKPCEECGVPLIITSEYLWLDNGDVVQARDRRYRMLFSESEYLDPLFRGMGEIIGFSIERIVIACVRRTYRTYLGLFLPDDINERVRKGEVDIKSVDDNFRELARPNGSGRYEFVDMRYEGDKDDFFITSISEPYSLPMCAAAHCAAMEAILGYDHDVTYTEAAPNVYNLNAFPSEHPEELKGRMLIEDHHHTEGDIELERCPTCGGPKALSQYKWLPERSVVVNQANKRRVAIMGPSQINPIFQELEMELGDTVSRTVVEAQRRFVSTGFYSMDEFSSVAEFRTGLALRGLGNLREFKVGRWGMRMRLDNAALPMIIVGIMQGVFDTALDMDSNVEWELTEDGDLYIEITPVS